jgi:hypothetical protein
MWQQEMHSAAFAAFPAFPLDGLRQNRARPKKFLIELVFFSAKMPSQLLLGGLI